MNRQSTDLLDFFGSKGPKRSGGARARSNGPRATSPAMSLGRAHLLLGGAGVVVLMVLSFILGLSVGRKKGPVAVAEVPLVAKASRPWSIRSRTLPRLGSGAEALVEVTRAEFTRKFPHLAPFLDTQKVYDVKGKLDPGKFRLVVRGFETREAAESWSNDLRVWTVSDFVPFHESRAEQLGDK